MKVYLCGPITGRIEDSEWRTEAAIELSKHGIETLNPMDGKNPLLITHDGLHYDGALASTKFARKDHFSVREADAILCHVPYVPDRQMVGTFMELGMAADQGKFIALSCAFAPITDHLFIREFCNYVCEDIADAVAELIQRFALVAHQ